MTISTNDSRSDRPLDERLPHCAAIERGKSPEMTSDDPKSAETFVIPTHSLDSVAAAFLEFSGGTCPP